MVSNLTESSAQNALKLLQDLLNFCSACLFLLCMDFSKAYSAFFFFFQFISLSSAPQPPLKIIKCSQLVFKSLIPLTLPGTLDELPVDHPPKFPWGRPGRGPGVQALPWVPAAGWVQWLSISLFQRNRLYPAGLAWPMRRGLPRAPSLPLLTETAGLSQTDDAGLGPREKSTESSGAVSQARTGDRQWVLAWFQGRISILILQPPS